MTHPAPTEWLSEKEIEQLEWDLSHATVFTTPQLISALLSMAREALRLREQIADIEDEVVFKRIAAESAGERSDELAAEVKRLHEKYDLQLLVQRNDQLTVEVVELRKELARQASSHGLYITQNVEPKMGELKGEIARLRSTLELIAEGPAEGWVGLAWKALTPEGEKGDDECG